MGFHSKQDMISLGLYPGPRTRRLCRTQLLSEVLW